MRTIRLGIAGFGRIVELTHLPLLGKMDEFSICGIFDVTPQRRALAEKRGLAAYDRLEELLASDAEAILIATPPGSHYSIAAEALKSGKHVLIEKPVTLRAAEAIELKKLAAERGKHVTVFHNKRFDDDLRLVREVMDGGKLGPIQFVERRCHQFGSGASFGVQSFHPGWRNETAYGGGALMDWGVHLVDQLLQLKLGRWQSIEASAHRLRWKRGDAEDCALARIVLDNGILLSMDIHFGSHAQNPLWIVGGELGTLQVTGGNEATIHLAGKSAIPVEPQSAVGTYRRDLDGVKRIYSSFARKLAGEGQLEVTLDEAIDGLRVLDAIRLAAENKKEVRYGDPVRGASVGI
ncbi:Gfo/Idh/MocA family protein [Cohnella suwonensis]|uniref:Gfo/Idh/MocA family protein n=1 Tax=Cohnella suwonensis TaxID=696072 RepID=A0ABW0LWA2_9BACL